MKTISEKIFFLVLKVVFLSFYCCFKNYYSFSELKQQTLTISLFLWDQESGHGLAEFCSTSEKTEIKVPIGTTIYLRLSTLFQALWLFAESSSCGCRVEVLSSCRTPAISCHMALSTTWKFASSETVGEHLVLLQLS